MIIMKITRNKKILLPLTALLVVLLLGITYLFFKPENTVKHTNLTGEIIFFNCINAGYPCTEENIKVDGDIIMLSDPSKLISQSDNDKILQISGHTIEDDMGFKTFVVEQVKR